MRPRRRKEATRAAGLECAAAPELAPKTPAAAKKSRGGQSIGRTFSAAGKWLGSAAAGAGRSLLEAFHAVDPDVRRHVAQMPLAGLSLLAARSRTVEPMPDDRHPPVLFVHGLGGHRGNFLGMQAMFALAGRTRTYALGFDGEDTLEQQAEAVRRAIADIIRKNRLGKDRSIDLVAHSMGGLVARLALEHPASRGRVGTLVTLGTPHGGTFAARFGASDRVRELRPGSVTLRTLQAQMPWTGRPRLVCFWSSSDVFLLPATTACLEGARNIELEGCTHYSYLIDPRGTEAVLRVLADVTGP